MARSLVKTIALVVLIFFLLGIFRINKMRNMIEGIESEELVMELTEDQLKNIKYLASKTLNSINPKSEIRCPEFLETEIFYENFCKEEAFKRDFKNNEFSKRLLESATKTVRDAVDRAGKDVKLVKIFTMRYKDMELKVPYAFE